ncbi:aldehyde dehydrogenase [Gloeomargarita lithophora Alchichica-D10]|uniref:Aldehyde dehydrogenase n=1 Tax=Gloeomargarita lithophora Alchichica-D10 TaxID=1188229 RepID=A0A1J0AAL8_9CYAN|nr:NAD-dependent succinate-semialdehyde dehydrogenase [Gloeomargarita lithophora]APB32984.1 aldehyde dehydrogenase [Gloeomargarita lithophora Alchichica-D10]
MAIASINPWDGSVLQTFAPLTDRELEAKLSLAATAFATYRQWSLPQRAAGLNRLAAQLLQQRDTWARTMTLEMGKPIQAALAEVDKCAWVCRYYAEQGAEFLQDQAGPLDSLPDGTVAQTWVRREPLGVILAVMPWNFPFWQVFRCLAPALMAGNALLLKHASNVPQTALGIEQLVTQAGFPPGVMQTLLIEAHRVAPLVADPRIRAATLTGSEAAGIALASAAGRALKKTVLELGGSDPLIILPSADLEMALTTAVAARMLNNGQSCIAAKRFILHEAIAPALIPRLVERFQALNMGNPLDPTTELGPLATPTLRDELHQQVTEMVRQGAQRLCGGQIPPSTGNFYPATLLTHLPPSARHIEFFGPVALVYVVPDLETAIATANDSPFGLGASAWTRDPQEQTQLLMGLEAGSVFINGMVRSDPRLPFGGTKQSGYGRELGEWGLLEFVNIKTLWVKES